MKIASYIQNFRKLITHKDGNIEAGSESDAIFLTDMGKIGLKEEKILSLRCICRL